MSKSIMIKGLEFWYTKIGKPVAPFGTEQWEMVVAIDPSDTGTKKDLEDAGLTVKQKTLKDNDVEYDRLVATVKRTTKDRKGNDRDPVRVVDNLRQPVNPSVVDKIGNRSEGNIIVFSYDWEQMGRKGKSAMLTAVQVTKLEEYNGGSGEAVDFDIEEAEVFTKSSDSNDLDFG